MVSLLRFRRKRANNAALVAQLVTMRAQDTRRLGEQDFVNSASTIGVSPAALATFSSVESNGNGFSSDGRLVILYEPHVASRNTKPKHAYIKKHPRLFRRSWQPLSSVGPDGWHPYREDQLGRWDLVAQAAAIDFEAALKGTSWGAFQILGENAESLGFRSAFDMVQHMNTGYPAHIDCAIRFLRRNDLIGSLRQGDWETVARRYNGPGNASAYAAKFEREFERQGRIFA